MAQGLVAYMNGEWIPSEDVKIDRRDRGFRVADTVFDVARTFNGVIYRKEQHLNRFYRSLKYTRIDPGLTKEEMGDLWDESVERNRHLLSELGDFYVYPFVTRGPGRWAYEAGPPTVVVDTYQVDFYRYARFYEDGSRGVISKSRSYSHTSIEPKVKHHSRMNFNMAELEAGDIDPEGFPILLDQEGNVTEGTVNSVFLVKDGVIRTPGDSQILQSESRASVVELAEDLGITCLQEDVQPYDLYTADETFLAFTGPGVLPMTQVDKRDIADGKPGPITQQLIAALSEKVGVDIPGQAQRFAQP